MEEKDLAHYYQQQEDLKAQIIQKNELPTEVKYIAGVDVAYQDDQNWMVGAVVVLDAHTLEVVEQAVHRMEISFPYIPGLFSFREIPPLVAAFNKLATKVDLIICDAQGIAHPKGIGMASHLGIVLDIPTIGCAKKRLIGEYDKEQLNATRGSTLPLTLDDNEIGKVLRTQTDIKAVFVSIGHKVSLDTAVDWVLKACPTYRLPETTRQADQLVNRTRAEYLSS